MSVLIEIFVLMQLLTNHGRLEARPVNHIFQKPSRLHKVPLHHENDDECAASLHAAYPSIWAYFCCSLA